MSTVTVNVYKFPETALERLRAIAVRNGVGDSNTDVLRWAALQYLRTQDQADATGESFAPSEAAVQK